MKKIMFSDKYGLTEAVLNGYKTQTRRLIPDTLKCRGSEVPLEDIFDYAVSKAHYKIGEVVAVAQSYETINETHFNSESPMKFYHKQQSENLMGWKNKMFVSAKFMIHQIQITNIRIEKLQDISDEDCISEGIICNIISASDFFGASDDYDMINEDDSQESFGYDYCKEGYRTAREAYSDLIDDISGKGTWQKNPYIFVYDFKLTK